MEFRRNTSMKFTFIDSTTTEYPRPIKKMDGPMISPMPFGVVAVVVIYHPPSPQTCYWRMYHKQHRFSMIDGGRFRYWSPKMVVSGS